MTLIQQFARCHNLQVVASDAMLTDRQVRSIHFPPIRHVPGEPPSAVIFDIEQEYRLAGPDCGITVAKRNRFIAKVQKRNLLAITLFHEQLNKLYREMSFDVPRYDNSGEDSGQPNVFCRNSGWYAMLRALGFEYHDGDDDGLCLTFPARSAKATKIALMLAGHRDDETYTDTEPK